MRIGSSALRSRLRSAAGKAAISRLRCVRATTSLLAAAGSRSERARGMQSRAESRKGGDREEDDSGRSVRAGRRRCDRSSSPPSVPRRTNSMPLRAAPGALTDAQADTFDHGRAAETLRGNVLHDPLNDVITFARGILEPAPIDDVDA